MLLSFPSSKFISFHAMVMEGNDEVASGWPLGLGSIRAAAVPPLPNTLHRLRSFSSFSSSNLDTESTGSFFPDQSVSLGKLIGIRPVKERGLCCKQHRTVSNERSHSVVHKVPDFGQGLCAPLLYHVMGKKGYSKRQ